MSRGRGFSRGGGESLPVCAMRNEMSSTTRVQAAASVDAAADVVDSTGTKAHQKPSSVRPPSPHPPFFPLTIPKMTQKWGHSCTP